MIHTDVRKFTQAILLVVLCLIYYANNETQAVNVDAGKTKLLEGSQSVESNPARVVETDAS